MNTTQQVRMPQEASTPTAAALAAATRPRGEKKGQAPDGSSKRDEFDRAETRTGESPRIFRQRALAEDTASTLAAATTGVAAAEAKTDDATSGLVGKEQQQEGQGERESMNAGPHEHAYPSSSSADERDTPTAAPHNPRSGSCAPYEEIQREEVSQHEIDTHPAMVTSP